MQTNTVVVPPASELPDDALFGAAAGDDDMSIFADLGPVKKTAKVGLDFFRRHPLLSLSLPQPY